MRLRSGLGLTQRGGFALCVKKKKRPIVFLSEWSDLHFRSEMALCHINKRRDFHHFAPALTSVSPLWETGVGFTFHTLRRKRTDRNLLSGFSVSYGAAALPLHSRIGRVCVWKTVALTIVRKICLEVSIYCPSLTL